MKELALRPLLLNKRKTLINHDDLQAPDGTSTLANDNGDTPYLKILTLISLQNAACEGNQGSSIACLYDDVPRPPLAESEN